MSEEHFWDRVQSMLDLRLDPLEDDEIASGFLEHPEWAAALVTMTSRLGFLDADAYGVGPRVETRAEYDGVPRRREIWSASRYRSVAVLSASAALVLIALGLIRVPRSGLLRLSEPVVVDPAGASPAIASVFRVESFVSWVSTVAPGEVTERAEVVRDGRVVAWSTASQRSARDGSFVVRSAIQSGRPGRTPWERPLRAWHDPYPVHPGGRFHDDR